jgi:putative ATPase
MAQRMKPPAPGEDLFPKPESEKDPHSPLAVRMRPRNLDEVIGQEHLLAPGKLLQRTIQSDRWMSMIFYGPPGSGKTTLAYVISKVTQSRFVRLNAVTSNAAELRQVISEAQKFRTGGKRTILFLDEIHRFNKAQQDILMPDVEEGNIILIGATTHNPSFAIIGPLLSRSAVFELRPLTENHLKAIMKKALSDPERGLGKFKVQITEGALEHLAKVANGDARRALIALEIGVLTTPPDAQGVIHFDENVAVESCQKRIVYYDADEDYHYDTASAFIKSMRGSDPDAAVYWLAKMLYAGEDPRFIMRRILILASEDIGNADPQALILASSGLQAIEFVGLPEAQLILSQLVTYMALAPKSNASTLAISKAMDDVQNEGAREVPEHLRDAHYKTAKKMGHGAGYQYPHGEKGVVAHDQEYMPRKEAYYVPRDSGYEKILAQRLKDLKKPSP